MYSISVAQYRPHRPHRLQCGRLQGILAVGTKHCLPTARDHYRPLSNIPPAYRPLGNVAFSGSFFLDLTVAVDAGDTLRAFSGTSMSCRRMEPVAKSFREGEVIMEVLSSRVLVRPNDFERSFRFYTESLGLHVSREWSSGSTRGVGFFLGGGFLELSGSSRTGTSESIGLWLQVPDVDAVGDELEETGVDIVELPTDKPWGLREMQIRDPDGLRIVIVEVPADHPLRRR
jgi:predicted enzyme related to lactoylglutathione lyase